MQTPLAPHESRGKKRRSLVSDEWLETTMEGLPACEEIERFAESGSTPQGWSCPSGVDAAKILSALTRRRYPPARAEHIWRAVTKHEQWMARCLGRRVGVRVATMDYLANVVGEIVHPVIVDEEQMGEMANTAMKDVLTGLYSRRVFDHLLVKMVAEARRYGTPLSMLVADVDDFKKVNDHKGHQAGDEALRGIGLLFLENLRSADLAARYGGEELAVVLPQTNADQAKRVAENIRRAVKRRFQDGLNVTISVGVASWRAEMNQASDLVRAADAALYTAKERGKNRVMLFGQRRHSAGEGC